MRIVCILTLLFSLLRVEWVGEGIKMETLVDKVQRKVNEKVDNHLDGLIGKYKDDKIMAKSFSVFTYIVSKGYNVSEELAEQMAEVMEAFFLATSIHDDIIDRNDKINDTLNDYSINDRIVLGDYFFVEMAVLMGQISPKIDEPYRTKFLEYFTEEMLVVAKSQMIDQKMVGEKYTEEHSLKQSEDRGGSWGRLVMGSVATACGAPKEEVELLTCAANNLFISLTILDDLQDLKDDIQNGIYSLAPSYYLNNGGNLSLIKKAKDMTKIGKELQKSGAIKYALKTSRNYAGKAQLQIDEFLQDKEGMNWFQLKAFFGSIYKQLNAFSDTSIADRI